MHHVFYLDGDKEKISWNIQTNESNAEQSRIHVEMYKDKVTNIQSKYIAFHVGLFWGIGTFKIKNKDKIKVMIDDKIMYEQLTSDIKIEDDLVVKKIHFIKQLAAQRKLELEFVMIDKDSNLARKKES